jgi:hypothetical protein
MTLIVSCVTPHTIYQVSDRRLTNMREPKGILETNATKAVFANGRMSFGYTGIAEILGQPTDLWLMDRVAEVVNDAGAIFEHIRARATEDFPKMTSNTMEEKRHVFQIVWWYRKRIDLPFVPAITHIENTVNPETAKWLPRSRPEFKIHSREFSRLTDGQYRWISTGYQPSPDQKKRIKDLIRGSLIHERSSPLAVIDAIAMAIREISRSSGTDISTVGEDLLAVRIPKTAVERAYATDDFSIFMAPPSLDAPTFLYLPKQGGPIHYGPHLVMGGAACFNVQVSTTGEFSDDLTK